MNIVFFELIFVLFLFAGQYKAAQRFVWIPLDLTALLFLVSIFLGLSLLLLNKSRISKSSILHALIFAVFVLYVIGSTYWSASTIYAFQKAFYISTLVFWSFLAPCMVVLPGRKSLRRFLMWLLVLSLWFALEAVGVIVQEGDPGTFVEVLGSNYLGLGRILGIGLIVALVKLLYEKNTWMLKTLLIVVIASLFWLLLSSGGRGPLLSLLCSLTLLIPLNIEFSRLKLILLNQRLVYSSFLAFIGAGFIVYLLSVGRITTTIARFAVLFSQPGGGSSASIRMGYFVEAWKVWSNHPIFGGGIGSWPVLAGFGDVRNYPHNIFLETLAELGLVGLLLLGGLVIFSLYRLGPWQAIRADSMRVTVLLLFAYALLNASFSGDFSDNRFMFTTLGLMGFSELPNPLSKICHIKSFT